MNYFVGTVLGSSGYERQREKEFTDKNLSRAELISGVEIVVKIVNQTLSKLNQQEIEKIYPVNVFQKEMTTEFFLLSLLAHLNYHLGQINYLRRLLDK